MADSVEKVPCSARVAVIPYLVMFEQRDQGEDGTFSRTDFTYDKERDLYICPGSKTLKTTGREDDRQRRRPAEKTTGRVHDGKMLYYRASKFDREACPLKARCCPKSPERRISRDPNEAARDTTAHVVQCRGIDRVVSVPGAQEFQEVQPALG